MNKLDMIISLTRVLPTRQDAAAAVNRIFEEMSRALKDGDKVVVQGFGSFHVVIRKSKPARNPRTGQSVIIPSRRRVKFRQAKDLLSPALKGPLDDSTKG